MDTNVGDKRSPSLMIDTLRKFTEGIDDMNQSDWDAPKLSTGSTLLNCCLTNDYLGGLLAGRYYLFVGDSSSGKTMFSMTLFAEAARADDFKDHRLIYDDVEGGNLFELKRLFGKKTVERLEAPSVDDDGMPLHSDTIESFYYHIDDAIKHGQPFIYILDSMDALDSDQSQEKFQKQKDAYRKGKDVAGSYGDGKAKLNSSGIRQLLTPLRESDSILILISQTRDNIGSFFGGKTRSGGRALTFYAAAEIWTSVKSLIKRKVKGKDRLVGKNVKIQVKKNRLTGREDTVFIPILPELGIDDTTSCVQFLVDEHWGKQGTKIVAPEFSDEPLTEVKLVGLIESEGKREELAKLVGIVWNEIIRASATGREGRYE